MFHIFHKKAICSPRLYFFTSLALKVYSHEKKICGKSTICNGCNALLVYMIIVCKNEANLNVKKKYEKITKKYEIIMNELFVCCNNLMSMICKSKLTTSEY